MHWAEMHCSQRRARRQQRPSWGGVKRTCEYIAEISSRGYEIAVIHGNGPQVGRIILSSETNGHVCKKFNQCFEESYGVPADLSSAAANQ